MSARRNTVVYPHQTLLQLENRRAANTRSG